MCRRQACIHISWGVAQSASLLDICHPCPYSRVACQWHRCGSINSHWHARRTRLTMLLEALQVSRIFFSRHFLFYFKIRKCQLLPCAVIGRKWSMKECFRPRKFAYLNLMDDRKIGIPPLGFLLSSLIAVAFLIQLPPAMHVQPDCMHFPKVISSTTRGQCDYFSPHFADYSFITASGDGKQRGMVTEPE